MFHFITIIFIFILSGVFFLYIRVDNFVEGYIPQDKINNEQKTDFYVSIVITLLIITGTIFDNKIGSISSLISVIMIIIFLLFKGIKKLFIYFKIKNIDNKKKHIVKINKFSILGLLLVLFMISISGIDFTNMSIVSLNLFFLNMIFLTSISMIFFTLTPFRYLNNSIVNIYVLISIILFFVIKILEMKFIFDFTKNYFIIIFPLLFFKVRWSKWKGLIYGFI